MKPSAGAACRVAWSPDGALLAAGAEDGTVSLWSEAECLWRVVARHAGPVTALRWSPAGDRLASASADGTCAVRVAGSGALLAVLAGHAGPIAEVAWSGDGRRLATASADRTCRLWDSAGSPGPGVLCHADHATCVDWGPHGLIATGGDDAAIRLWAAGGELVATWRQPARVAAVRWRPGARLLAAACGDGVLRLLDESGAVVGAFGRGPAAAGCVAWSPDGRLVAAGTHDGRCRVYDVEGGLLTTFEGPGVAPWAVDWHPRRPRLALSTFDAEPAVVDLWAPGRSRVARGRLTHTIGAIATMGDGGVLVGADDGAVRLWEPAGNALRSLQTGHGDGSPVTCLAFREAGQVVVAGTHAGNLVVRSLAVPGLGGTLSTGLSVSQVAFGPDGLLAVADSGGRVTFVSLGRPGVRAEGVLRAHEPGPTLVAWLDAKRVVTAGADRLVKVLTRAGETEAVLHGHGDHVSALAVGRRLVATGSRDRTVRVWEPGAPRPACVLVGHAGAVGAIAFGPGAALLTAAADHTARLWDLEAPEPAGVPLTAHRGAVTAAVWLREMPCTAGRDAACVVWSPVDGRPLHVLELCEASAG